MTNSALESLLAELKPYLRPTMLAVAAIVWLATLNSPWGFLAALHYVALAMFLGVLVFWFSGLSHRPEIVRAAGMAGVALALLVYSLNETYTVSWEDRDQTQYVDRRRRWGGAVEYRTFRRAVVDELGWTEGPMVQGLRHGRWERHEERPPKTDYHWYWEGKAVSQQDWQRLNESQ